MPSFVFQGSNMIAQIVTNNLLNIHGTNSIYGNDIPIAVAGIVAKIYIIFIAIIIGLIQGAQPIFGYNYGAKKYERVRTTMRYTMRYVRFFLLFTFINGVHISSSTFFSAIGKPKIGVTIALTKQVIVLIPMLFILSHFFGIEGIIYATPVTDLCAISVSLFFLIREFRTMPKQNII